MKTQLSKKLSASRWPIKFRSHHAKRLPLSLIPFTFYLLLGALAQAEDSASPISLPPLEHYSRLWTESLFTTRALPPPEAPAGPNFATNLALTGTFEVSGKMAAVLIDKASSGIMQVLIGEDNAEGIRITKVEPGLTPDKMRIQLQKGREFGWVTFGDDGGGAGAEAQPGMVPTAAPSGPLSTRQGNLPPMPQVAPPPPQAAPIGLQNVPRAIPATEPTFAAPVTSPPPNLRSGAPTQPPEIPNDVPLPPP